MNDGDACSNAPGPGAAVGEVRTLHHLACTGGTIISRAIAVQPEVVLLSEISPTLGPMRFNPLDPVQQFLLNHVKKERVAIPGRGLMDVTRQVLSERLRLVHWMCLSQGENLVLRDHAHSDFMMPKPRHRSGLLLALAEVGIATRSIATLRDPVDTWLSICANGWQRGVSSFDDFCRRQRLMLAPFDSEDLFLFEDFCLDPVTVTQAMCNRLNLSFDPDFQTRLGDMQLTGASGRGSETIAPRQRKPVPKAMAEEVAASDNFAELMSRHYGRYPELHQVKVTV